MDNSMPNRPSTSSNNILNPVESFCLSFGPRQQTSKTNNNDDFAIEIEDSNESPSSTSTNQYGYLKHIQTHKPLCRYNDGSLPKNVREFYAKQLELIESIEAVLVQMTDEEEKEQMADHQHERYTTRILITTHLVINIILVIIKLVGAIVSRSLAVISSVVNSVLDIRTNLTLIWAGRSIKKRDPYKYPAGRTRLQPVYIIILSVIMCTASVQIIIESSKILSKDIQHLRNKDNASTIEMLHDVDVNTFTIIAMGFSIVSKAVLFILSYSNKHTSVKLLNADNRNGVISSIVALTCGLIASNALDGKIKKEAVVIDPLGAIVISVVIIIAWSLHAYKHIRFLTGHSADPFVSQRITHIAYNYRPDVIIEIDLVQVSHFGMNYFAYVDVVLSRSTPLAMAHDIGMDLQAQLETMHDIERAFIHLDFESTHMPAFEHKRI